jgi:hypothetical protein
MNSSLVSPNDLGVLEPSGVYIIEESVGVSLDKALDHTLERLFVTLVNGLTGRLVNENVGLEIDAPWYFVGDYNIPNLKHLFVHTGVRVKHCLRCIKVAHALVDVKFPQEV